MKRTVINAGILMLVGGIMSLVSSAYAGEVYVVGGKGKNSVRTIAEGVSRLKPGDTLQVMPGRYHEGIVIPCDDVSIVGKDTGVVLDGAVQVSVSEFEKIEGREGVFKWKLPEKASSSAPWVFYNDEILICRESSLDTEKDQMCFFIDSKARKLEININGKDIPVDAKIAVPVIGHLVDINKHRGVSVRGVELTRSASHAIQAMGSEGLCVEYCFIHRAGNSGILGGHKAYYARNTVKLCNCNGIWQGDGNDKSVIEENLIVANQVNWNPGEYWAGNLKQNNASHCLYRQNWVMDHTPGPVKVGPQIRIFNHCFATGIWPDINCNNNCYEGNAIARLSHAGLYIEYTADRNIAIFNCVQDCGMGITLRQASANLITRNWVWDREFFGLGKVDTRRYAAFGRGFDEVGRPINEAEESAMWGRQLLEGICLWHSYEDYQEASRDNSITGNLIQVSGRAVSVPMNKYKWPVKSERTKIPPPIVLTNQLDRNYYDRLSGDKEFVLLGNKVISDFNKYQEQTGWDLNSRTGKFTTAVLGLEPIWTLPWAALKSDIPVAILHDPSVEIRSALNWCQPMFWYGSHVVPDWVKEPLQTRWEKNAKDCHSGVCCLSIIGASKPKDKDFTETLTWSSASIPVKPKITMGVNMWLKADNIQPARTGAGVKVYIRFADAVGFPAGEKILVGKDTNKSLVSGSYSWTNISGEASVPENACWMNLILGLEPSEGKVSFDDIHINLVNPTPPTLTERK